MLMEMALLSMTCIQTYLHTSVSRPFAPGIYLHGDAARLEGALVGFPGSALQFVVAVGSDFFVFLGVLNLGNHTLSPQLCLS